jgi:NAD(P)-dependent dehydrogenase (short-subunit alcohol dehydrogenase family)
MTHTTTHDQLTKQDPVIQYPHPKFPQQSQDEPGLAREMEPKPDHGEETYKGLGRLKGRKAIITGADSGIGRATAIAYAREGADVMLAYLSEEEADAREVLVLLKGEGHHVVPFKGDISDEKTCQQLIAHAVDELDGLDILVNNAGKQVAVKDIADISTEQFDKTFRTNIYATFWLSKYALEHMKAGSAIINNASIQAYSPSPTLLDYASTKAAIVAFTKALAKQVAEKGIRVNAVAPGPIWTPLQPSHGQPPEKIPVFGEQSAYGRPGQPAEVAPVFVFLASQEASYITGETYGVTGGNPTP